MKPLGFFLLAVVLCVTTPALAQSARDLEADRLADKLWRILDITKQYQPQFQAYVTLEAPDGERVALTFQGESARTLVHDDVITLARKSDIPGLCCINRPDRPSENEATTSGNVALPVHKTMASSTMITCPTVAKISVSQPV